MPGEGASVAQLLHQRLSNRVGSKCDGESNRASYKGQVGAAASVYPEGHA